MKCYPRDKSDNKELARLNVEPWMLELLKLNPSYPHWGPHEDYMIVKKGSGWNSLSSQIPGRNLVSLSMLTMKVVNFYFEVDREHKECPTCGGNGYHPDAHWVSESFYSHSSPFMPETYDQRRCSLLVASLTPDNPEIKKLQETPLREPVDWSRRSHG